MEKASEEKTLKKEQKNRDFVQLYRDNIDNITDIAFKNVQAYKLLMLLIKHMDGTNSLCVSTVALSEILGCGRATVFRAIKYLKENGWVCVLKTGNSNVYIVNPDVAWTSYGNQKQYCKFQTNVLLSSTENAEYLNNREASTKFKRIDENFIQMVKAKQEKHEKEIEIITQMNNEEAAAMEA